MTHLRTRLALACGVATALATGVAASASAADMFFWGNYVNVNPSTVRTGVFGSPAADVATNQYGPEGMVIDTAAGKIYWAQTGGPNNSNAPSVIRVANLDGSDPKPLYTLSTTTQVTGLALNPANHKLYWSAYGDARIRVGDTSGTAPKDLFPTAETNASGLAIDVAANKIYWGLYTEPVSVRVGNLDGTGTPKNLLPTTSERYITGVAIDPAHQQLYWVNEFNGLIRTSGLDGSNPHTVVTENKPPPNQADPSPIGGVAVDPEAGKLYYGLVAAGQVKSANLDGSNKQPLFSGETAPWYVVALRPPQALGAPSVSGGGAPGQALACSTGTWSNDAASTQVFRAPRALAYQWLKEGAAIGGATSDTYTPFVPGSYSCTVTATNQAGSASQTSGARDVVAPPSSGSGTVTPPVTTPPPPKSFPKLVVGLGGSWTVLDRGVRFGPMSLSGLSKGAKVKLSCPACHVRQTLTAKGKKLSLRKLRGKLLPRGKSLTITATKAGAIGQQLVIKLKSYGHTKHDRDRVASNPFRVSQRCIPVGKTKPAKTCPAAPGS